jgi:hypothetical protein
MLLPAGGQACGSGFPLRAKVFIALQSWLSRGRMGLVLKLRRICGTGVCIVTSGNRYCYILCGILLGAAGLRAGTETSPEATLQSKAFAAAHTHLQNRFLPPEQVLLANLVQRVRRQLPHGARLPEDARRILAGDFPSFSGIELNSLSSYIAGELLSQTQQMQETQMSFNLQYLQLQENLQSEDREYSTLSNLLKTRQDTIKATLGNIR